MLLVIIRTLILYVSVVVLVRLMGKREIGQLQPFELVIIIMISELAAIPMENTGIPLLTGLIPLVILLVVQITLSYLTMKSQKAREIICGTPTVLVENGKIIENELRRLRYNVNDLLEQLRIKNIANISDVEFAILETGGQLSVIPKSQKRPVQPEDLKLDTKYEGLPATLVVDGQVNNQDLAKIHKDENWLKQELSKLGIKNIKDVLMASLDTGGKLFYQVKTK